LDRLAWLVVVLGFFETESQEEVDSRLAGGKVTLLQVWKSPRVLDDNEFVLDTKKTEYEDNE